jgi:putative endonuclease
MKIIKQRGREGEDNIAKLLLNKGLVILERNYHSRFGEIDIIAVDLSKETIVFIEVKNVNSYKSEFFPIKGNQIRKIVSTSKFWQTRNLKFSSFQFEFWGVVIANNTQISWFELLEF